MMGRIATPDQVTARVRPVESVLRLLLVLRVLVPQYHALRRFATDKSQASAPARFAASLVALGPTFVKLGQMLSTRPDVLPEAYVEALATLQEHGPEISLQVVEAIIEGELGEPAQALFATFETEPVAAASLAQVHRATLPDGTSVAVKVQRPDLDGLISRDLDAFDFGLRWAYRLFPQRMRRTNLRAFLAEFRRYTLQELDFSSEARTIDQFRANFEDRDDVKFPTVYWSRSSRRVLTMSWAEGFRLHDAVELLDAETKQRLVTRLVDVLLKMFVSDGLFHADLHPGNIVFHRDGTFTLLDFGMHGKLTPKQRDRFILYWFSVVQRQTKRAFHHLKAQTQELPDSDEAAFFARFAVLADKFYASRLSEMSFTKVYLEMMIAGYEHGFVFPSELMLHAKALTTAETLIFVLAPDVRFEQLSRPFIAREYAARAGSLDLLKRRASQLVPELLLLGEMLPLESLDESWDWNATVDVFAGLRDRLKGTTRKALEGGGFWKLLVERHAEVTLKTPSLGILLSGFLEQTWDRYYELEPTVVVQPTVGAVFSTHAAALVLAMRDTLRRLGIKDVESHRVIFDIGWRIYQEMAEPPLLVASAFTRDPRKRLEIATNLFRSFPFGSPSYQWRDVASPDDAIAFDCVRCPVAEFFSDHGASDLCVETFCRLDYPLAEMWGGELKRSSTIAAGAQRCDFRWYAGRAPAVKSLIETVE